MRKIILSFTLFFISCGDFKPLDCSINKQICTKNYKGKSISFEILNRPIRFMNESKLLIKGLPNYDNLSLKLTGLNMDMGEINAELIKNKNGDYESVFVLSSCTLSTMRYRLEILNNDKKIGLFIDFDMQR